MESPGHLLEQALGKVDRSDFSDIIVGTLPVSCLYFFSVLATVNLWGKMYSINSKDRKQ